MKKLILLLFFSSSLFMLKPIYGAKGSSEPSATSTVEKPTVISLKESLKSFSALSRSEKKSRFREMRKAMKQYKESKNAGDEVDKTTILQIVIGFFLPPLAVYLHQGSTDKKFWISVLLAVLGLLIFGVAGLFLLGTLPSIIYAMIVILSD